MSSNDPIAQSHYTNGVNSSSAAAAGRAQAQINPSYTAPQQNNESHSDYLTRINTQKSSS